eukprot:4442311-Amphidinium_carterae.1
MPCWNVYRHIHMERSDSKSFPCACLARRGKRSFSSATLQVNASWKDGSQLSQGLTYRPRGTSTRSIASYTPQSRKTS